jgi:S-adenosylmethionine:tRNA ribosyltransferase-isomerase
MTVLATAPSTVFPAPADNVATEPPELRGLRRDGVRLLVASADGIVHTTFDRLDRHLRAGDVLVVNTSATVPGQLDGTRHDRPVVVHVANRLGDGSRVVELRTAPDAAKPVLDAESGETVELPAGGRVELLEPYPHAGSAPGGVGNRLWRGCVRVPGRLSGYLAEHGRPISYGHLPRRYPIERYQTIFAVAPGSVEMPSAGRPFSAELVTRLVSAGIAIVPITLHTGVSSQEAYESPQEEWFEVSSQTAAHVNAARPAGGRVIAVGTTATRALESAARPDGTIEPRSGWTDLVISPDRPPRTVRGLITGWHDPEASHLLLVEAVAGSGLTQRAYDAAVAERYLWHEFGDSCLLLPH